MRELFNHCERSAFSRWGRLIILVIFFLALPLSVFGSDNYDTVVWGSGKDQINGAGNYLSCLEDPSGELGFEDVRSRVDTFVKMDRPYLNWSFTDSTYWCFLDIRSANGSEQEIYIATGYAFYDEISMYALRADGRIEGTHLGDWKPFNERPIIDRDFIFPLSLEEEPTRVFFRFKAQEALILNTDLWDRFTLDEKLRKDSLLTGMIYGVAVVMLLYNLCLLIWTRELLYLFYALFVLTSAGVGFSVMGLGYQYLWPESPIWNNFCVPSLSLVNVVVTVHFYRVYLATREHSPRLDKALVLLIIAAAGVVPFIGLVSVGSASVIATGFSLLMGIGGLVAGLKRSFDRYRPAYYFLVAFSSSLFFVVYYMLAAMDFVAPGVAVSSRTRPLELSFISQVVLIAFGLASRINQLRKDRENLQEESLRFHERAHEKLEIEVERQTSELRDKNNRLHEADRIKTGFFQSISHELRTPLTLILNPLQLEAEREPGNNNITVALRNSLRLLRLVNQLLDFQKVTAGRRGEELTASNLSEFASKVIEYFRPTCEAREISVTLSQVDEIGGGEIPGDIFVRGEIDSLEKIAFNLLSNAYKHCPTGGRIEVELIVRAESVRFVVRDNGPGIALEDQGRLFEVFSQLKGSATGVNDGTGLGLALVKELAEHLGATVGVESQEGEGASFWVEFGRLEEEGDYSTPDYQFREWMMADSGVGEELGDRNTSGRELGDDAPLVLVVDDIPDMRNLIMDFLSSCGYRTVGAKDGVEGLQLAEQEKPHLVVSDWMMPEMTGPQFIMRLKSDPGTASIPVILLTARSDSESRSEAVQVGADAFLGKPFTQVELESQVRNLLTLKRREIELESTLEKLEESELRMLTQARLATVGHLIGGVVHEVGNPLNFVVSGVEIVREEYVEASDLGVRAVKMIEEGANRIEVIIENLRDYLDSRTVTYHEVSLKEAVESTLAMVSAKLEAAGIKVLLELENLPEVQARQGEIKQVILNLLLNSAGAMQDGGEIRISASRQGPVVSLRFVDTGPGIPAENRESVFDPFFTTKEPGEGTGLGLSVSHSIAKRHGGDLRLDEAEEDAGAAFILSLPIVAV